MPAPAVVTPVTPMLVAAPPGVGPKSGGTDIDVTVLPNRYLCAGKASVAQKQGNLYAGPTAATSTPQGQPLPFAGNSATAPTVSAPGSGAVASAPGSGCGQPVMAQQPVPAGVSSAFSPAAPRPSPAVASRAPAGAGQPWQQQEQRRGRTTLGQGREWVTTTHSPPPWQEMAPTSAQHSASAPAGARRAFLPSTPGGDTGSPVRRPLLQRAGGTQPGALVQPPPTPTRPETTRCHSPTPLDPRRVLSPPPRQAAHGTPRPASRPPPSPRLAAAASGARLPVAGSEPAELDAHGRVDKQYNVMSRQREGQSLLAAPGAATGSVAVLSALPTTRAPAPAQPSAYGFLVRPPPPRSPSPQTRRDGSPGPLPASSPAPQQPRNLSPGPVPRPAVGFRWTAAPSVTSSPRIGGSSPTLGTRVLSPGRFVAHGGSIQGPSAALRPAPQSSGGFVWPAGGSALMAPGPRSPHAPSPRMPPRQASPSPPPLGARGLPVGVASGACQPVMLRR